MNKLHAVGILLGSNRQVKIFTFKGIILLHIKCVTSERSPIPNTYSILIYEKC